MSYQPPTAASESKRLTLSKAHRYLMPDRVETFGSIGVDLVIGKREGYRIWDVDGRELLDFHLNGGTYNVGHRNPRFVKILQDALETLARATGLRYTLFTPSGSEANDMAIKSARHFTGRRKIVSMDSAYHGRSGLSGAAGDDSAARFFNSDYPDEFIRVPFDDLEVMEEALRGEQVAAVLMETIPATFGFPVPSQEYLPGVRELCDRYGSLYIADEVQTGLGRSGHLWAVEHWGVKPETLAHVREISDYLYEGLRDIQSRQGFLVDINRLGLIMGLKCDHPNGGVLMTRALFDQGLWAIFAGFDASALQFKGGLLIDKPYCDLALEKMEAAIKVAREVKDDGERMSLGR